MQTPVMAAWVIRLDNAHGAFSIVPGTLKKNSV